MSAPTAEATVTEAHTDGRHASEHPDDYEYWAAQGCCNCAVLVARPPRYRAYGGRT